MTEIRGDAKEFEVGDDVTVVGNDCDANKSHIGEQGKVVTIFPCHSYYPFEVLLDSGERIEFSAKELELTKKPSETITYEEALKLAIDGTKVCVTNLHPETHVFFENGKFMWHSGLDGSTEEMGVYGRHHPWKVWVKPEPPKPPKFQPKQFVVNATGDIGIIAEHKGYHRNIPEYNVRFNGVTEKTKPVLETELSEVVL